MDSECSLDKSSWTFLQILQAPRWGFTFGSQIASSGFKLKTWFKNVAMLIADVCWNFQKSFGICKYLKIEHFLKLLWLYKLLLLQKERLKNSWDFRDLSAHLKLTLLYCNNQTL